MRPCSVYQLGEMPYAEAWELQKVLASERGQGQSPDALLLVEHPHTYTLGSAAKLEHLVWNETERAAHGIAVYRVDRGGDITYHGPGQLVGYPILQLPQTDHVKAGVVDYIRSLEAVLIETLAQFEIQGERLAGYTGVWVGGAKIAAIGVKVTARRVTYHGFALNINTDLRYFHGIIPCGIVDKPVTSMQVIIGQVVDMAAVIHAVTEAFGRVLGYNIKKENQWQKNMMS